MKLYEVEERIQTILAMLEEDAEVSAENDRLIDELSKLEMDKQEMLTWLVKKLMNIRGEVAGVKAEAARLSDYKKTLEAQDARLVKVISSFSPEARDFGIAKLKYTKSEETEIQDEEMVKEWLIENDHPECVKAKYEVQKTPLKALIKKGAKIPGARLIAKNNPSIK
jgi:hypothetical protein